MKILVASSGVGRSPQEIAYSFVFDEVVRLARRGLNVSVARFKLEGNAKVYGVSFYDTRRSQMLTLPLLLNRLAHYPVGTVLRSPFSLFSELLYSSHIENLIRKLEPDLLHAHFAYMEGWSTLLAKLSISRKVPFVVTLHGYDVNVLPEYRYGIRLRRGFDALVKKVLRLADCVIAVSRDIAVTAKELGARNVVYVPNGVDTRIFNYVITQKEREAIERLKSSWAAEDADLVVGFFRHLRAYYGVHYILLAAKALSALTKRKVKFVLGGDNDPRYAQLLFKYIERGDLKSRVFYTGIMPRDVMPIVYKACDVVVNTSLTDGMPPSMLEAMASGKPLVSFAVGGNKDIIIHGYNGLLVTPKNYKDLASKLAYLVDNPSEIKRLGSNSRKLALEKFDIEKRIDKIVEIYKNLISE
ncbi:MAG: glycosyltransferase [Thermofilum sp.]|nr:glycosyltransferase [Thermofilum sp.]